MHYYDLKRNWTRKIVPHLNGEHLNHILVRDFNRYTMGRWGKPFTPGMLPEDIESCDWRCNHRPPYPRFWRYVKHAACHWIVNFSLRLAELAEPTKAWAIITSNLHSTVWDGKDVLFDFNFNALGITPEECWRDADNDGERLKPGEERYCYLPDPFFLDYADQRMSIEGAREYFKRFAVNRPSLSDMPVDVIDDFLDACGVEHEELEPEVAVVED